MPITEQKHCISFSWRMLAVAWAFLPTGFASKWWTNDKAVCPPYQALPVTAFMSIKTSFSETY
jgi:hypothetical protein